MKTTTTAILLIDCPDRKGIVASIVNFLVQRYDVNILNADQHQDVELSLFFMRVEFSTEVEGFSEDNFRSAFEPVAREFRMNWRIEFADTVQNVAIFVSHYLHCLADLLHRHQAAEFQCKLAAVVSNHTDAQPLAEFYGVPFHHFSITAECRASRSGFSGSFASRCSSAVK